MNAQRLPNSGDGEEQQQRRKNAAEIQMERAYFLHGGMIVILRDFQLHNIGCNTTGIAAADQTALELDPQRGVASRH